MSGEDLVRYISWAGLLGISAVVLAEAVRRPRRATIDAALLFAAFAGIIVIATASRLLGEVPDALSRLSPALLMALAYLVLRLADGYVSVPALVLRLAEAGLVVVLLLVVIAPRPYETAVVLVLVAYFVLVQSYATWRFVDSARAAAGVVRRRLLAVAAGSGFLAVIILLAGVGAVASRGEAALAGLSSAATLGMGVAYFLGFATPRFVKHAWQAPDLERFLELVSNAGNREPAELALQLESLAAQMLGVSRVTILYWGEDDIPSIARGSGYDGPPVHYETTVAAQAFRQQRPLLVEDSIRHDPDNAEVYRYLGAQTVLAAPLSTPGRRLGVIVAYGERASPFAEDDLALLDLVARQVAVALRNQELVAEQARLRAQEEATRLKEEFLSAAAHDLKTPLTTLVGQTQLMQRRARRGEPGDRAGLDRLAAEADRMRRLVENLLDASRAEQQGFVYERTPVDLLALAQEVAAGIQGEKVRVEGDAVTVPADRVRMAQVIANLLDNAVKYGPRGGEIAVHVSATGDRACLAVSDRGAGIPAGDREVIFERFQRGSSVANSGVTGLGLGLYLCKRIVEEHGGEISVDSVEGGGSRFTVTLPLKLEQPAAIEVPTQG